MPSEHLNQLLEKRARLQLRIRFNEFVKTDITPFTVVLNELQLLALPYRIVSMRYGPAEFQPLFAELFQSEAFVHYGFPKQALLIDDTVMTQLVEAYPNAHSSRYFPDLPVIERRHEEPKRILQHLIKDYQLPNTSVYIAWLQYPFLLEVPLGDLADKVNSELLSSLYDDVVIFPKEYRWLLVYHAFEDEWLFGKH